MTTVETRPATLGDRPWITTLGASQQGDPTRFQAYFGDDPGEIGDELDESGPWVERTIVAVVGGEPVGWVYAEHDPEVGRVWWWGPVVDPGQDWPSVAEVLLDEAMHRFGAEVEQFEFAVGDRHHDAIDLAVGRDHRRDTASVLLRRATADPPVSELETLDGRIGIDDVGPGNATGVAALHDRTFPTGHLTGAQLAASGDADIVLAATVAGGDGTTTVCGYLRAETQPGGDGYIDFVGVDPEQRGRGIGGALVAAAIVRLVEQGVTDVALTVREDNLAARALYERLGFDGSRVLVPLRLGFTV